MDGRNLSQARKSGRRTIKVPVKTDRTIRRQHSQPERNRMLVRGKVPLRVSLCGGGTDVPPYCDEHGGCVLSSTINMHAYATIEERDDDRVNIRSLDYESSVHYDIREELSLNGKLDLIKAVVSHMAHDRGFNLFIHTDAPPGSGLGSSGCICTMMVGLIGYLNGLRLDRDEIAEKAIHIERNILGVPGGRQDQYAAVYGGINYIEFGREQNVVYQLRLDQSIVRELEYHLLLVYTEKKHYSGDLIDQQIKLYEDRDEMHLAGLAELKELTDKMKEALVTGKISTVGCLLHDAWVSKKKMNPLVATPQVDEMYEEARKLGALGGKLLGAGGGGYLLLFCPFLRKHAIAKRVREMGGTIVNFDFVEHGLQIWHIDKNKLGCPADPYILPD